MYESFYGLRENPFRLTPDPAYICMTEQHQEALSGLIYSVCTRSGLTVLVGEAGTGKTTLIYSLLGLLEERQYMTAVCTNPTLTRVEFYDHLLLKFGVKCDSELKSRQLAALEERIRLNREQDRMSVLVVDEAQRLSPELLEEVRLLLNLETTTEKLLQIIIAGQPELEDVLRQPELRQLKQRVNSICRLKPLNLEDLTVYLYHRLGHAGRSGQKLFGPEAIAAVFACTKGIPRLVNSVCDAALQIGFALQAGAITVAMIDEVARDLDLTPPASAPAVAPKLVLEPAPEVVDRAAQPPACEPELVMEPVAAGVVNGAEQTRTWVPDEPLPEVTAAAPPLNGHDQTAAAEFRIPLANYTRRQQSLGFFASLLERWK